MAQTRAIKFATTDGQPAQVIYSNARTWGELKQENADIYALAQKKTAHIKGDSNNPAGKNLSGEYDPLPEGDFVLYFLITKNDSGN